MTKIERTPPTDPLHRKLWQMGFTEGERNDIICAANGIYGAYAVALGQLINRMRPSVTDLPREKEQGKK